MYYLSTGTNNYCYRCTPGSYSSATGTPMLVNSQQKIKSISGCEQVGIQQHLNNETQRKRRVSTEEAGDCHRAGFVMLGAGSVCVGGGGGVESFPAFLFSFVDSSIHGIFERAYCTGLYDWCADERNTCYCSGLVRYGLDSRWRPAKEVSGSIYCNNDNFGGDPAPGAGKVL